jgi:glycosyltransferase involved in cell wall biosynthesis
MWQVNVLTAFKDAGLLPSLILSQQSLRAFPHSRTLWSASGQVDLHDGLSVNFIPFLNLPVFRPFTVGLAVLINLICWAWHKCQSRHKVVYTLNLNEPPGLFTLIAARLIDAKAIASVNDVNVPGETVPATLFYRLDFWLQKKLIPHFDGLVVVNTLIVEDFAPDVPFVHVAGGVSEEALRSSDAASRSKRANSPFTIVSVGTLSETNGFVELLEAFSLLPGDGYRLRIAGTGPLEERIKQAVETNSRIEHCGYLAFDQVLALYGSADVLINMRLTKKVKTDYLFPSKTIEYLASGVRVITSCTGHIEEEFADMAFLLKDKTSRGLASMIEQVASMDSEIRSQRA